MLWFNTDGEWYAKNRTNQGDQKIKSSPHRIRWSFEDIGWRGRCFFHRKCIPRINHVHIKIRNTKWCLSLWLKTTSKDSLFDFTIILKWKFDRCVDCLPIYNYENSSLVTLNPRKQSNLPSLCSNDKRHRTRISLGTANYITSSFLISPRGEGSHVSTKYSSPEWMNAQCAKMTISDIWTDNLLFKMANLQELPRRLLPLGLMISKCYQQ